MSVSICIFINDKADRSFPVYYDTIALRLILFISEGVVMLWLIVQSFHPPSSPELERRPLCLPISLRSAAISTQEDAALPVLGTSPFNVRVLHK